jgi:osmotically-inducible protein OsmY
MFWPPHWTPTPRAETGYAPTGFRGRGPRILVRSDTRLREDICELITRDDTIDPENVEIAVSGGVVTLTGTVAARAMKYRIEDLAQSVPGVREIDNRLRVTLPLPRERYFHS